MRQLSEEESGIASRFLFLSMAIIVLHQDGSYMRKSPIKIKEPYIELIEKMTAIAVNERRRLRQKMHELNMQVMKLNQNNSFTSYLFICQGREEKCNYFNPIIRKKVMNILYELMQRAQQPSPSSAANI